MGELSIRIKIADREYPMKTVPEEEEKLRTAGKEVNERLKKYREQFGIHETQDLLAMVAFDSIVERLRIDEEKKYPDNDLLSRFEAIEDLLDDVLKE